MRKRKQGPSLVEDLGALTDLYKTVFWLIGQRVQHGRDWQRHLGPHHPPMMVLPDAAEPVEPVKHKVA